MSDPLSELIALLRPRTVFTKGIAGAGAWAVRYADFGQPSFCAVMDGACLLAVDGQAPVTLEAGDFVLLPATPGFVLSGFEPAEPQLLDPNVAAAVQGDIRHGASEGEPEVRLQGGYFVFDSPDADLLVSLLPPLIHLRGAERLATLVRLVREEAVQQAPGRDLVLARLVEVLLIEAVRAVQGDEAPPGLLRGLAEPRLAAAIRRMHGDLSRPWKVTELAREAAMSRSAFFERFTRVVGAAPMEYLLGWRMAVARHLLRERRTPLADIAEHVGYNSTGAFSTAFTRHVGQSPGRYARGLSAGV